MRKLFLWLNFSQTIILTISLIAILLLSNFLCLPVNAHPLNSVKASGLQTSFPIAKLSTLEDIQNDLVSYAEDTQASLRKNIKSANEALKNMPGQLQKDLISMNAAEQAMKRNALVKVQKKLEASAKVFEKQAAQLDRELLRLAKRS